MSVLGDADLIRSELQRDDPQCMRAEPSDSAVAANCRGRRRAHVRVVSYKYSVPYPC